MIDSHAHLYFDRFDGDRDSVIERAREAGVLEIVNVGIDVETSRQAIDLALQHDGFHATVGLHPTSPVQDLDEALGALRSLAAEHQGSVVAVGEIGLDYYWKDVAPEAQKEKLKRQLTLARELKLPVIFHCRDALPDLFAILEQESPLPAGVFHCFSGESRDVARALALGFHISFAGNVTYPKAKELAQAAKAVPADKLLLETDAPFLPPQPRRGRRNEPSYLTHTCDFLATIKGMDAGELAELAAQTTRSLFHLSESA